LTVFFSWNRLATPSPPRSNTVELTDADRETKVLLYTPLQSGAAERRLSLALLEKEGLNGSTSLDRVAMPPINKGILPFALHPLEKPIHRRLMHRDRATSP